MCTREQVGDGSGVGMLDGKILRFHLLLLHRVVNEMGKGTSQWELLSSMENQQIRHPNRFWANIVAVDS